MDLTDFTSYVQLIQDILAGTLRRNTFTRPELDFLLDVQASSMRKTMKEELLRRYLRAVQQQVLITGARPLRFSHFCELENTMLAAADNTPLLGVRTASSA